MTQTFVSIPIDEWQKVVEILERLDKKLMPHELRDEWIGTDEACEILHVTKNTWLAYRKKYNIKTTQMGRKVLVLKSEINKILKDRIL